ncbi:RNA-directed DNA polymerase, eukaryota, reverse transcriptase zinc-binding domain protein, partial [Tanacetum coccineum]
MSFGGRLTSVKSVLGHVTSITWGRGLNIGSLRAINLALLGKWWWRFRNEGGSLWVRVIKSIHGVKGALGDSRVGEVMGEGKGIGVWRDIIRVGEELEGMGIGFTSSCIGVLGDGNDISFWLDRWVDDQRLCDRFSRLFLLDRFKEGSVRDKGSWVNGMALQNVVVSLDCRDRWMWTLFDDEEFKVKNLSRLIEEKILQVESRAQETLWNKLVPKKVNIFVWRALKGRLPIREELNKRGIDLDWVLCPSCTNVVESCAHCDLAMGMWDK